MTKLEMCKAIMNPKTKAQEWLCEKYAKEHSKYEIEVRYNQMLKRIGKLK